MTVEQHRDPHDAAERPVDDIDMTAHGEGGEGGNLSSNEHQQQQVDVGQGDSSFDWEAHLAAYTGRARIERLLFIAEHAPSLRSICSSTALSEITSSTKDVQLYHRALYVRNTSAQPGHPALADGDREEGDASWCEKMDKANRVELEKLDLELRNYQNNLIKESIRMGYRDLGDHLRATGNLNEALKYYTKTRDFCSTNEHVVEMCVNVIEVSLELKEYTAVGGYVNKADGLLDTYNPHAAAASSSSGKSSGRALAASKGGSTSGADAIGALFRAGGSAGASTANGSDFQSASNLVAHQREAETQGKRYVAQIRAKLNVAQGLAYLGQYAYEHAVRSFLKVEGDAGDAYSTMASRADLATYIVLCGLAMLDRNALKATVAERQGISSLLGHDTHAQQLLEAFHTCEYRRALTLLEKAKVRSMLNITLAPHYEALCRRITQRALRQFVQPFDTLQISRLALSLGWKGEGSEARTIDELLYLIQKGEIDARLDLRDKVLYVNKIDPRQALYQDAFEAGQNQSAAAKRVMLRVSLLQNGLVARMDQAGRAEA